MPILAAMSSDGIHFALTEEAQGLSPESPASLLHYEGGGGDTGAMRAWRDPEFLRDDQGTVLSRGVGGYRYVYFSAHVPRRASMLATLKMCGSGGDHRTTTLGPARQDAPKAVEVGSWPESAQRWSAVAEAV